MFWLFAGFVGLIMFAVTLGQYSVWFVLLKLALIVALTVVAVFGALLWFRKSK